MNENKNELFEDVANSDEAFDFEALDQQLEGELEDSLSDLHLLQEDEKKIGNPESLGSVVLDTAWEQFILQIGSVAGEDFIKENRGLTLDLRDEAHIQTTENFAQGTIATHNTEIDYQKRYDDWQSNFKRDENGQIIMKYDSRSGTEKPVLTSEARAPFDKGRPAGSAQIQMDHVTSVAENVKDPAMNAHLTKDEQIAWVNSKDNLQPLDAAANASKGDSTTSEWLDSERDGKKPAERFNIDEEQLRKNDKKARTSRKKRIKEGEERSIASGKKTQRDEAVRIGGKALRAAAMALLAELAKTIIGKLVQWMKSAKKNLTTFVEQIKAAVQAFLGNLKSHLQTAGTSAGSAVLTAIVGPIASLLQKTWVLLKQGAKSVKEAIAYIKAPENRRKSFGVLMLEVGKIVTAGVSAMGAVVLGEVITKSLMAFPIFMIELPLIGSLASVIGIFLGAIISGILGALVLNLLNKIIAKKKKREIIGHEIDKGNEILAKQAQAMTMAEMRVAKSKRGSEATIHQRHEDAAKQIEDALGMICLENHTDNREKLDDIQDMLESF